VGRQALAALTGARAQEMRIEKARADSELQVAREIQKSLLPEVLPVIPGFEVAASSEACFSVGGDLEVEDETVLDEQVESVECRWCGAAGESIEVLVTEVDPAS